MVAHVVSEGIRDLPVRSSSSAAQGTSTLVMEKQEACSSSYRHPRLRRQCFSEILIAEFGLIKVFGTEL